MSIICKEYLNFDIQKYSIFIQGKFVIENSSKLFQNSFIHFKEFRKVNYIIIVSFYMFFDIVIFILIEMGKII